MYEKKNFGPGNHVINDPLRLRELVIEDGAEIEAPDGKYLTMTINGNGHAIAPGSYHGDILISVSEHFIKEAMSMGRAKRKLIHSAVIVKDGKVIPEMGVPAIIWGGEITDKRADGVYIATDEPDFCGVVVEGDSEYTINKARMEFYGTGSDDFMGIGSCVTAYGRARVTVNNSELHLSGARRCAVHVGGESVVTCNNCNISNRSPEYEMGDWSWGIAVRGTNRLNQLADNGTVYYNNCRLTTNGWGVLSVDGSVFANMFVKDSILTLTGPNSHGYGAFCIGPTHVRFDHSVVDVYGYPVMMMGMGGNSTVDFINGTVVKGRRFGVLAINDDNGTLTIKDSTIDVDKAVFAVKGSATAFNIERSIIKSNAGVIMQLMDSDETGMSSNSFQIPVGLTDTPDAGRDLTDDSPDLNVTISLTDMYAEGDFFNSTTNLRANKTYVEPDHDKPEIHEPPDMELPAPPAAVRHNGDDLCGSKNLVINLENANVKGLISSARAEYAKGLTVINQYNREELTNVTQYAAPTVNNGVIVKLTAGSVWTLPDTCYITALNIEEGSAIKALDPKQLRVIADGEMIKLKSNEPCDLKGKIELVVE